jgi:hypothetical protein
MKTYWLKGDVTQFESEFVLPIQINYPHVYDVILKQRNDLWLPQLNNLFSDDDIELVLVGFLHLVGEHSVLRQLEQKGYTVKQL